MDFHPVILAGGRGSRMYPLTEECPKALLPVGNRPLIWYPVQLLDKNGFEESIVVVRESQSRRVSEALEEFHTQYGVRMKFSLVEIPDQEDWGTADSLRALKTKIKTEEVLLISCDLVTMVPLHLLLDYHACHNATLTTLLLSPSHPPDEQKKKATIPNERDIIGLTDSSQLVYFTAQADLEEYLTISRNMMKRHPHIRVCSQLKDAHLYLMKKWVLDYLSENRSISSVKGELVPHLVRHQSIETTPPPPPRDGGRSGSIVSRQALQNAAMSSVDELEKLAYQMSSFAGLHSNGSALFTSQLIRCYAFVIEKELCIRVNTVPAYININRMLPQYVRDFQLERTQSPSTMPARGKGVSSDSLVGGGVLLSDKASVKKSVIGQHCSIGDKTKIISSVLMDHVQIGEGCNVQSCVVCSNVRIEERVNLKDCLIGPNFTVTKDADIRGETLVVGGEMDF